MSGRISKLGRGEYVATASAGQRSFVGTFHSRASAVEALVAWFGAPLTTVSLGGGEWVLRP